ncbi:hypothetical protein LPJ53_002070 [Coemansia erecta]|uniref:Myb-like domain-containing protein n=1 Tax=Coemansia erecta TaxID=147472 RepID=A0A9W7Y505_9FUNG|nr:hypothetical protein LPJ53_002070 [Coemansia erecta]
MNTLRTILRRYTTKPQLPISFLEPNISPLGSWGTVASTLPPPRATTPWSLAERRALLLYVRAITHSKLQDPSWSHIAHVLSRTPIHCRFIGTTMLHAWMKHNPEKRKQDAGISADQLLLLSRGELPVEELDAWDGETQEWLRKLVEVPEKILLRPGFEGGGRRMWTEEQCGLLKDHCGLYRYPVAEDMEEVMEKTQRPLRQLREKYTRIRNRYAESNSGEPRAFDERELEVIRRAAEQRRPLMIRWMDVKDGLAGRTFEEVVHLTQPRKLRHSIKPKEGWSGEGRE